MLYKSGGKKITRHPSKMKKVSTSFHLSTKLRVHLGVELCAPWQMNMRGLSKMVPVKAPQLLSDGVDDSVQSGKLSDLILKLMSNGTYDHSCLM